MIPPSRLKGLQGTLRHPTGDSWNYEPRSSIFCTLSSILSGKCVDYVHSASHLDTFRHCLLRLKLYVIGYRINYLFSGPEFEQKELSSQCRGVPGPCDKFRSRVRETFVPLSSVPAPRPGQRSPHPISIQQQEGLELQLLSDLHPGGDRAEGGLGQIHKPSSLVMILKTII